MKDTPKNWQRRSDQLDKCYDRDYLQAVVRRLNAELDPTESNPVLQEVVLQSVIEDSVDHVIGEPRDSLYDTPVQERFLTQIIVALLLDSLPKVSFDIKSALAMIGIPLERVEFLESSVAVFTLPDTSEKETE